MACLKATFGEVLTANAIGDEIAHGSEQNDHKDELHDPEGNEDFFPAMATSQLVPLPCSANELILKMERRATKIGHEKLGFDFRSNTARPRRPN